MARVAVGQFWVAIFQGADQRRGEPVRARMGVGRIFQAARTGVGQRQRHHENTNRQRQKWKRAMYARPANPNRATKLWTQVRQDNRHGHADAIAIIRGRSRLR
jgi:hypothetical protein